MTSADTSGRDAYPGMAPVANYGPPPTVALGTAGFAGAMLIMVSVFQILQGIAAVAADDVYVTGIQYVYQLDLTSWGWIHITIGVIALAAGLGVLAGQTWAYIAGIVLAAAVCFANFVFLPYYPLWSLIIIAFNIAVIWALCTLIARRDRD